MRKYCYSKKFIDSLTKKCHRDVGQILSKRAFQHFYRIIFKLTHPKRIISNHQLADFKLLNEEIKPIASWKILTLDQFKKRANSRIQKLSGSEKSKLQFKKVFCLKKIFNFYG